MRRVNMGLKLPEYARRMGITPKQAWVMYRDGTLPHKAEKISTRLIIVDVPADFGLDKKEKTPRKTAVYARVSSQKQKDDLEKQTARLLRYAAENQIHVDKIVEEIASGMNGNRRKLNKLLADPDYNIIVEHRDRLTRFGFEAIEASLSAQDRKITIVEDIEVEDDLVRDMTEVLTSFCARMYGKRGARNRARQALKSAAEAEE